MSVIKKAFEQMYPEKSLGYDSKLKYSGKFNSYNANIKLRGNKIVVNMSRKWKGVDDEIKIGLIQELLNKLFKTKIKTNNMDLYNIFIKKIALYTPKTKTEPFLDKIFEKINEDYFYGLIEKPNLAWCNSTNKLGSYDFGSDTISISRALLDKEARFLEYVMYHEILHKKMKFENKDGRTFHHTKEFRKKEREFENAKEIEEDLKRAINQYGQQNITFINKPKFLSAIKRMFK